MFGVSETPYDVRFHFLGIPVRVHPMFWLVSAMLGWQPNNIPAVLIWVACVFVSILIHEYGHGSVARAFGCSPWILLWGGGGLCYSQADRQTPGQRLAVVLSGPGAGFVLCGLVMLLVSAIFGVTPREHLALARELVGLEAEHDALLGVMMKLRSETTFRVYWYLVQINILWGLVNLLPVWPLDGGRVSEIVLSQVNPRDGARWGHTLSLLVAGVLAVLAFSHTDLFLTIFLAYFAFMNFQILQAIYQAHRLGISSDEDWWNR
ncbi:MAG TPA: site-2 protease family protein [Isosphaeraceae bacterium]|nr:site-2 protease family protein [Isosphaeraceae bacterium]